MAMMALRTPADLQSPQLGAVSGGVTQPFPYESYVETMASYLPEISAVEENRRMQQEALKMQREQYAQENRDATGRLIVTGGETLYKIGTNPTVKDLTKKYGSIVGNAIQPKAPVVEKIRPGVPVNALRENPDVFEPTALKPIGVATPSAGYVYSGTPSDIEPGIQNIPVPGTATGGTGTGMPGEYNPFSATTTTPAAQPSTMSRIGGFKGIDVPGGALAKMGIGAAVDYGIKRSNFGEGMSKAIGGGKNEWDLGASSIAAYALGGLPGLGLGLASAGVQAYFKKNPKLSCIIVTACTSIDSEEVKIARAYRDKYMDTQTRRGYYMLADQIVPILQSNEELRKLCLEHLVLPMIRFGKWKLCKTSEHPSPIDCSVTKNFLALCHDIGGTVKRYTRANSEEEI